MTRCPDCHEPLDAAATSCPCGWYALGHGPKDREIASLRSALSAARAEIAKQAAVIAGTAYPSDATLTREQAFHGWEVANRQRDGYASALSAAREEARRLTEAKDGAYRERDQVVALAARMALLLGWRAGLRRHEPDPDPTWDDDWKNVVAIDLPAGQVTWHFHDSERPLFHSLPPYPAPWDGHDTAEKYRRVNALLPAESSERRLREALRVYFPAGSWCAKCGQSIDAPAAKPCADKERGCDAARAALGSSTGPGDGHE